MPSINRKITDLDLSTPAKDHNFVVATFDENYRLLFNDIAEHSSIGTKTGEFLDSLTISGVSVTTGDFKKLEQTIEDLSGYVDDVSGNVDTLSGHLYQTGRYLEYRIDTLPDTFLFFNDVYNNIGPCEKTYHETPNGNIYLSGITVNMADDLNISMRWDGPFDDYAGTGAINNAVIDNSNVTEVGLNTRRFEGHIDNLFCRGGTEITGFVNGHSQYGVTGTITLEEVGPDPYPSDLYIDDIANATPLNGMLLGTEALKQGDVINVFVEFDPADVVDPRQQITGIQVQDYGISDGIDWFPYTPTVLGNGMEQITIPVTVSDRIGDHGVSVRASNLFGATGNYAISNAHFVSFNDSRWLDQCYPTITVAPDGPAFYNGRTDGLREGESVNLINSVADCWDPTIDSFLYGVLSINSTLVTANDLALHENPKTFTFSAGIFADQPNITMSAIRFSNGAISTASTEIRIANAPEIVEVDLNMPAIFAQAPHRIGTSSVKGGDLVETIIHVDTQGSDENGIEFSVLDAGIADGSQVEFQNGGPPQSLGGDIYTYRLTVFITDLDSRNGSQSLHVIARNEYGTISDVFITPNTIEIDNNFPSVSVTRIDYPTDQQAIKNGESAEIVTSSSDHDQAEYSKPDNLVVNEIDISNPNTFESPKICTYAAGDYNVTEDNFKITVIKSTSGATNFTTGRVNIANEPLSITFPDIAEKLRSSSAGTDYRFTMSSTQLFNDIPSLSASLAQASPSTLTVVGAGVGTDSNTFDITVNDLDTKGSFRFEISAFNLANIETTISDELFDYNIEGFISREIEVHPNDLLGGIADIGTTVTDPNNIIFENLSEAGDGLNGGTPYSFDSTIGSIPTLITDVDDKFFVCNVDGSPNAQGSFIFNLDSLSRASNADVRHPARFLVEE